MKAELLPVYHAIINDRAYLDPRELIRELVKYDQDNKVIYDYADKSEQTELRKAFRRRLQALKLNQLAGIIQEISRGSLIDTIAFESQEWLLAFIYKYYFRRYYSMLKKVKQDKQIPKPNHLLISQSVLIEILKKYLELNDLPTGVVSAEGICFGLSLCDGMMHLAGKSAWWREVIIHLLLWDKKTASLDQTVNLTFGRPMTYRQLFDRVIHYIAYNQGSSFSDLPITSQHELLIPQGDFEVDILNQQTQQHETKKIQDHLNLTGNFTLRTLKLLLTDELFADEDVVITVFNKNHACSLTFDKARGYYCFHDPNEGWIYCKKNRPEHLAALILRHLGNKLRFSAVTLTEGKKLTCSNYEALVQTEGAELMRFLTEQKTRIAFQNHPDFLLSVARVKKIEPAEEDWYFATPDRLKFFCDNQELRHNFHFLLEKVLKSGPSDAVFVSILTRVTEEGDSLLKYLLEDRRARNLVIRHRYFVLVKALVKSLQTEGDLQFIMDLAYDCPSVLIHAVAEYMQITRDRYPLVLLLKMNPQLVADGIIDLLHYGRDCVTALNLMATRFYSGKNFLHHFSAEDKDTIFNLLKRSLDSLATARPQEYQAIQKAIEEAPTNPQSPYHELCRYQRSLWATHGETTTWRSVAELFPALVAKRKAVNSSVFFSARVEKSGTAEAVIMPQHAMVAG